MNILLLLGSLALVTSHRRNRQYKPTFIREAVEKRPEYPFQNDQLLSRPRIESEPYSVHKSNLVDYVFRRYGTTKLPLREAVESLPVPLLSSEQRSFKNNERLPLRDAVEKRPPPDIEELEENEHNELFRSLRNNPTGKQIEHPTNYEVSYDLFQQFDPMKYQLLPNGVGHITRSSSNILGLRKATYKPHHVHNVTSEWDVDDDTVEILPEPSQGRFRSLSDKFRRTKGKKPWQKNKYSDSGYRGKEYKVVCYVEGWAHYRREPMTFNNVDIDPYACTHIIYAFAAIDPHNYFIYPQDEEYDIVKGGYRSVVGLKRYNPNLKVLISVSGWADSDGKFTKMTATAARRQKFIRSVAKFLDIYNFDGIDLDWEYPGAEELGGSKKDKENFSLLIEELSEVFVVNNWIISCAVSSSRFKIEDGYDVSKLAKYVDLINVMAFDLHSERDEVADHHAPLYRRDHDHGLDVFYNADYAVKYWMKKGAPKEKLNLGIPFFGRTFTLYNASRWQPGSEVRGLGNEGKYTQENGFMAYFEICDKIVNEGWRRHVDSAGSPYIVNGDQWIGYDDMDSISNKVNYIKKQNLGGAVIYSLDLDDFRGHCGTVWPLLKTIRRGLATLKPPASPPSSEINVVPAPGNVMVNPNEPNCTGQGYARDPKNCRIYYRCEWGSKTTYICPEGLHFDVNLELCNWPEQAQCKQDSERVLSKVGLQGDDFKIVCYFTNWAWYRKDDGKFVPEHLDPRLCTHIVYAFASLDPDDLIIKPFDVWTDIDNSFYERITSLSGRKTSVMLALGGWTDSHGDKYSRLVSDGKSRRNFVSSTIAFLRRYHFQGLHLDWNYPKCWQSNCNKGPDSDKRNFAKLVQELREEFDKENPPFELAVGISGYREVIDVAYDVAAIAQNVAFMSVMTYDYHGSWEHRTGHVSPLYYRIGDSFPRFNTNYTLEYLVQKGAPRQKILMGIPFYGQSFKLDDANDNSYGAKADGPGHPGPFTQQPGMLSYYEICENVRTRRWTVRRDEQGATGPYAFSGDQWVGYDDVEAVKNKAKYIKNFRYGGAMAWTVDLDDFNNRCCRESFPLLRSIGRVLGHISEEEPIREDCRKPPQPVTPLPPVMTTGVDTGARPTTEHVHESTTAPTTTSWPTWSQPTTEKPITQTPWWEQTTRPATTTTTTTTTTPRPRPTTTTTTTTTEMVTTTDHTSPGGICEPGRYYPDPYNCNAYYRCILGEYQKQYCLGGLHWNPQVNVCDWPENARCDKQDLVIPTTESTTQTWWTTSSTTQRPNEWWTQPSTTTTTQRPWWTESTTTQRPGDWWTQKPTTTSQPPTTVVSKRRKNAAKH